MRVIRCDDYQRVAALLGPGFGFANRHVHFDGIPGGTGPVERVLQDIRVAALDHQEKSVRIARERIDGFGGHVPQERLFGECPEHVWVLELHAVEVGVHPLQLKQAERLAGFGIREFLGGCDQLIALRLVFLDDVAFIFAPRAFGGLRQEILRAATHDHVRLHRAIDKLSDDLAVIAAPARV